MGVFDGVPVAVIASGPGGCVVDVNEEAAAMLGATRDELLGAGIDRFFPELPPEPHVLTVLQRADGRRVPVEVRRGGRPAETLLVVTETEDRFEVEAALHARRQMIDAAAAGADLIAVLDRSGTVLEASGPLAADGVGATIVGRQWREFVHPDDVEAVAEALRRLPTEGPDVRSLEARIANGDDQLFVDALVYVNRSADGAATSYVVLMEDVTARRAEEAAIRRSERQLNDAFEWSAAGLAIGEHGRLVRVNRSLCDILGRPPGELLGHDLIEFTHPEDRELTMGARTATEPMQYEKRYVRPDGSIAWGLVGGAVVRDERGVIQHYVGSIVDITTRKRTQEELARRAAQQAAIIDLGRTALDGVALDELFEVALRTATRYLGVEVGALLEVTGHGDELVMRCGIGWGPGATGTKIAVADSHSGYAMTIGRTVVTQDLDDEDRFTPSRLLRDLGVRSGVAAPIHVHGHPAGVLGLHSRSPRRFDDDDVMFVQSIAAVLASAMARERHEEMAERARQQDRLAVLGQMAAGLAHDFNNVLTVVKLHAELLGRHEALPDDGRRQAATISEQVDRAIALVWQLLDVARRSDLRLEPVDLASFVEALAPIIRPSLPERSSVDVVVERRPSLVAADMSRLNQIVLNLISNARDAMAEGGHLTLSVMRSRDGARDGHVLEVRDDGVGMSADVEGRAFDPFFSTKGPAQGAGLGLAQVRALVDQHDGVVTLHTSPGEGTAVRIWLPSPADLEGEPEPEAPSRRAASHDERVLVVEDDDAVADAVLAQLQDLGYDVVRVCNGAEALEVLATGDGISVVLSDIVMPILDGEELARRVRRDRPELPVVLTGARPVQDPALRELAWLQKPYSRDRLALVIADAVASGR